MTDGYDREPRDCEQEYRLDYRKLVAELLAAKDDPNRLEAIARKIFNCGYDAGDDRASTNCLHERNEF